MSIAVASGAVVVSEITSSETLGAATTSETAFDFEPSGFCICTVTLPTVDTSAAVTGAVHSVVELHEVARTTLPISSTDPVPPLPA